MRTSTASTYITTEALGGKYVPYAVLFDLGLCVIGAVTLSRRSASSSARKTLLTIRAGKNWDKGD
jgi:phosphoribosyl-dephospho-CoA transferase